jgi:hypothetical protein
LRARVAEKQQNGIMRKLPRCYGTENSDVSVGQCTSAISVGGLAAS